MNAKSKGLPKNPLDDKQVKFAISKTLNERMKEVQKSNTDRLDNVFSGGATQWTKKATVISRWAKREDLVVVLHHKDAQRRYLMAQEHGGEVTPPPNGRAVRVPVGMKTNRFGALPRFGVKKVKQDERVFSGKPNGWANAPAGVWRRVGRKKKASDSGKGYKKRRVLKSSERLTLLVSYEDTIKLRSPKYGFYKYVNQEARKGLKPIFARELKKALTTARK